jgi:hypothetical protein
MLNIGLNFNFSLKNSVFIRALVTEKNSRNVKRIPLSFGSGYNKMVGARQVDVF